MTALALAAGGLSFALAASATAAARRLAPRWGFVDHPSPDRHHRRPTPLLGGSAIFVAVGLPALAAMAFALIWRATGAPGWLPGPVAAAAEAVAGRLRPAAVVLAGAAVLHVIGLVDDRRRLGPLAKLAGQVVCAAAAVLLGRVRLLEMLGEPASSVLSVLWIVLITNAFNLLDHMDGLSAGVAAICSAALLAAAAAAGEVAVAGWLCLLTGASLGFLVHNFPPARVFMGDAGSMVLGYLLAVLSILTTYRRGPEAGYAAVFAPVVLLAVPLYDTLSVLVLRLRARRSPVAGDTRHFSHRLLRRGMGPRKAVLTIYLATAATAAGAALLPHVAGRGPAAVIFGQAAAVVLLIALLESADAGGRR